MDQNQEIFARYMNDKDFQKIVAEWMRKQVYEQIRTDTAGKTGAAVTAP
jgi:type I restriction enzyme R subunit